MKSINSQKKISIICYGTSALIFSALGYMGMSLSAGDEMGYCVLSFYIVMPLTAIITSFIISIKKGYLFWLYPVFIGFGGIIIPFIIFKPFDWKTLFTYNINICLKHSIVFKLAKKQINLKTFYNRNILKVWLFGLLPK